MKAVILKSGKLEVGEVPEPQAKRGEVVVALKAAGLNRRDTYIEGRWGSKPEPLVMGSDGAGVVESVGEGVTGFTAGDEVIINPSLRWFENSQFPPAEFDILGMPDNGTFAQKIAVHEEQLEKKPDYLSWEEAAVIPVAAITGYRAMFTKGNLQKGETVFIPGAGSGVATFLIAFAKNIGARVIVSSRSEEKRQKALEIGADVAVDTNSDWQQELAGETIDLVIDSVGRATFNRSLDVLKKGGKIVVFGATTEDVVELDLRAFFYGQYELIGTTLGSREEFRDSLEHMEKFSMRPVIDKVYPLNDALQAFDRIEDSKQFGKIVISIE